jgi:hypothetical protein
VACRLLSIERLHQRKLLSGEGERDGKDGDEQTDVEQGWREIDVEKGR